MAPGNLDRRFVMVASHGDGFQSGDIHGGSFQAIREYFQRRTCRHCSQPLAAEGIELVREEPGVLVVRVGCSLCGHPVGIALVGMNPQSNSPCPKAAGRAAAIQPSQELRHPPEWSRKDIQKLSGKPAITYDDVLDAHKFLESLGPDWARLLPKRTRRNAS